MASTGRPGVPRRVFSFTGSELHSGVQSKPQDVLRRVVIGILRMTARYALELGLRPTILLVDVPAPGTPLTGVLRSYDQQGPTELARVALHGRLEPAEVRVQNRTVQAGFLPNAFTGFPRSAFGTPCHVLHFKIFHDNKVV